jgi:hypothetical protein
MPDEPHNGGRDVEAQFSLCDDFLPEFALASDIGLQFSDAWFAACQGINAKRWRIL